MTIASSFIERAVALPWSAQQQAVFTWVEEGAGSAILVAVAGAGKTTTLVEAVKRMQGSVAFCAYNKAIATEIQSRVAGLSNVRAGTFHSFGFGAWRRVATKVRVDEKKLQLLQAQLKVDTKPTAEFARKAVSLAKQRLIGVLTPLNSPSAWEELVAHFALEEMLSDDGLLPVQRDALLMEGIADAQQLLIASIQADHEVIDFDDMLYAPLVHKVTFWQNDWVLVDEAQDTNPARRAMARAMLKPGGRLLAVGDPHQAIYGFTGADNDALQLLGAEFSAISLDLTVTYRCPKAVVRLAQSWVSHISSAPGAPEGVVETLTQEMFKRLTIDSLNASSAVLCRNTAPLVDVAYQLIRRQIPCRVEGRDIGRGLVTLINRWRVARCTALSTKLQEFRGKEEQRLLAKGKETQAAALVDKVDSLLVLIEAVCEQTPDAPVQALRDLITRMFADTPEGQPAPMLTLATIHKAKGREWERVYWLGRGRFQPSPYARQQWQQDQEVNLMYVAATRAKQSLVDVQYPTKATSQKGSNS